MRRCKKAIIFLVISAIIYIAAIVEIGLDMRPVASDIAVVLGNEVLATGEPSNRLRARLDCAVHLYRAHMTPRILVSGGRGKSGFDEASVMADYLMSQGVPKVDIIIDSKGFNTAATAMNTARLAAAKNLRRVIIVSQYYHLPRSMLAFKRAGLASLSADYPYYFEIGDLFAIAREAVAIPVYFSKMPHNN